MFVAIGQRKAGDRFAVRAQDAAADEAGGVMERAKISISRVDATRLASSWCVASAATALGAVDERRRVLAYLTGAIACGIAFVFIKIFEYSGVVAGGINVATDEFFMFYFIDFIIMKN